MIRDQIFISYSHKDQDLVDQLLTHLKPLCRSGAITVWSDHQIRPGSKWQDEITAALARTKVALLCVSKDFLASDFINDHELTPMLVESNRGGVTILWVLLRACLFKESPLSKYQSALSPDKPLAEMKAERDRAWVAICQAILNALHP